MHALIKTIVTDQNTPLHGQVFFALFDRFIDFTADDTATIEYVALCAEYMNSWDDATIDSLCHACIRYCNDFRSMIGAVPMQFAFPRDVLKLVYPRTLIVPNPDRAEPVVHLELNCEWEEEHGMEWIVRGEIIYVGAFNGQDPWRNQDPNDSCNYA